MNYFTSGTPNSERENLILEMNNIASKAIVYYRTPNKLGGGNRSFKFLNDLTMLGVSDTSTNGSFTISEMSNISFILTTTGLTEGIIVRATISAWGIEDGSMQVLKF